MAIHSEHIEDAKEKIEFAFDTIRIEQTSIREPERSAEVLRLLNECMDIVDSELSQLCDKD